MCCSAKSVTIVFSVLLIIIAFLNFSNVVSGFQFITGTGNRNDLMKFVNAIGSCGLPLGIYGLCAVMLNKILWIKVYGYIMSIITTVLYLLLITVAADGHLANEMAVIAISFPTTLWVAIAAAFTVQSIKQTQGTSVEISSKVENI